ncbi:hypothetical protein AMTR_s00049p00220880 [Amborella trichopoda]|uniref:Uncharacterized protein n=1 Tax=Amborella trichopoda TaxID=13333 RepID=W1PZK5_AMBTC|nr:hypothetical protein AMTR_s00049p00220880 [Amborella trichopoda]
MAGDQGHHDMFKEEGASDHYCSYLHQLERTPSIYDSSPKTYEMFQRKTTHEEVGSDHLKREKEHFSSPGHTERAVEMKEENVQRSNPKPRVLKDNGIDAAAGDYIMHMHKRLEMEKLMSMKSH